MNNIRLGYACYNKAVNTKFRKGNFNKFKTIISEEGQKNFVKPLIIENLEMTIKILNWNIMNDVHLYRFTSNMIPFETMLKWKWWEDKDISKLCRKIRYLCKKHDIQTSIHPDQFVVLNSPDETIVEKSIKILKCQCRLAKMLGSELVLIHVGSTRENLKEGKTLKTLDKNKTEALQRFIDNFNKLMPSIQDMIYIENDCQSYTIEEVLALCNELGRPMVADYHHDKCNPSENSFSFYSTAIYSTWKNSNLRPKIHLSSGKSSDTDRSHADYVLPCDLKDAIACSGGLFDIMLECKAKEKSLLRLGVDKTV